MSLTWVIVFYLCYFLKIVKEEIQYEIIWFFKKPLRMGNYSKYAQTISFLPPMCLFLFHILFPLYIRHNWVKCCQIAQAK